MSFVGKILVVTQVFLSLCFMAFAAAVYGTHTNWKTKTGAVQKQFDDEKKNHNDLQVSYDQFKQEMTTKVTNAENASNILTAENEALKSQVVRLSAENKTLEGDAEVAKQQAQIAQDEAKARREEANVQRQLNSVLQASRDKEFLEKTKLQDQVFANDVDLKNLQDSVTSLLKENSLFQKTLRKLNISADPVQIAAESATPPEVSGEVLAVTSKRPDDVLLEISIGSDDGLVKGHELFVYRSSKNAGGQAKYLGKMRIVNTAPDRAVGTMVVRSKNGVVQKGDNVTTKL